MPRDGRRSRSRPLVWPLSFSLASSTQPQQPTFLFMLPSRSLKFVASRIMVSKIALVSVELSSPLLAFLRAHLSPAFLPLPSPRSPQRSDYGPFIGGSKFLKGDGTP